MCLDFFSVYQRESIINIAAHPSLSHTPNRHAISCTWMQRWAGWAMYPTDPERWIWTKSNKNLFNFSYEMKLNANHYLYLWKTLLTKSAVAGFQLWVSSVAAFCLANGRFSLLRDKEVDVRSLVRPPLSAMFCTRSDAVVLCRFQYSVCKDLNGVVKLSGIGWSKFVGKFFYFYDAPAWRIHLNCYAPFWKLIRHWHGRANNLKLCS